MPSVTPSHSCNRMKTNGFSLVELAIVLVILGLLTGGVLTGQSLIRAAELRSISTEFSRYIAVKQTFRDKYFALPGDMSNATLFWGAAHATPATCLTTVGTGTQTCNGNGDGLLIYAAAASQRSERYAFWVHLANAGLIEGTYSGFAGSASVDDSNISVNVPSSKVSNAGWSANNNNSNPALFTMDEGAHLSFGSEVTAIETFGAVLTPEEAWNIDTKMDDGKPGLGKVIASYWSQCTTAASATDTNAANYDFIVTSNQCGLIFPESLE